MVLGGMTFFLAACGEAESTRLDESTSPSVKNKAEASENGHRLHVQKEPLGAAPNGESIEQFLLTNSHGLKVTLINYGAIVRSVEVPDRNGDFDNITLGFDNLDGYLQQGPYFGAICGRYANRIAKGKFSIDGVAYTLATNNAPNHLHGGKQGFDKVVWVAESIENENREFVGVKLTYSSKDGEEGYPGNLTVTVVYKLTEQDELKIEYTATADKATPVNLTNHCYWNLSGVAGPPKNIKNILNHKMTLHCDKYLPVDKTTIPTGQLAEVKGTPMDFTTPTSIGSRIGEVEGGYDHCYAITGGGESLTLAAEVLEPQSGRLMQVYTTEPGIQFYTGNYLNGLAASGGFSKHQGFCLECQHFPDSPNQPDFPNTILQPPQVYTQTTVYKFSIAN